eukprot:gene6957-7173_t
MATATVPEIAFSLQSVYACWKEFDLEGRRTNLDEIGLKVASLQEQSTSNRKKLADATRDFKRSTSSSPADSEVVKAAGQLLKQYQEEIDGLTRRLSKLEKATAGAAYWTATCLQAQKVSAELADYKAESKAIRNQELTLRKQEETIRELTAALEAKDQELNDAKQQAAAEADAAVLERMQAREAELSEMLNSAQSSLEAMQRLYATAQNQLFEMQSVREEAAAGRQEEFELAAAELDAVQARLMALEAEKHSLQAKLDTNRQDAATVQGLASGSSSVEETLRQELNSQRDVSTRLRQELGAARQQAHESAAAWEDRLSLLQDELAEQQACNSKLQLELQLRPTSAQVQELQQQVRALQAVGYGSLEEFSAGGTALQSWSAATAVGPAADGSTPGSGSIGVAGSGLSLEGMLLAKNRRLEHEITMSRLAAAEGSQQLEAAKEQLSDLQEQLQQKVHLVTQLEEDLLAVRQGMTGPAAGSSNGLARHSSSGIGGASDIVGSDGAAAGVADDVGGDHDSMLRVLVGQRERLRVRVKELEVQLAGAKSEIQATQQELAAARADNITLIERLRYVGGYRQQVAAARSNAAAAGKSTHGGVLGGDLEMAAGADVVGKYSQLYDESLNLFKEFQGQQREQKRKQMTIADKAMYSVGSLVYQSAAARLLAFTYIVILHLLTQTLLERLAVTQKK